MKIRIQNCPEDFVVEERISLPQLKAGPYTVYSLKKQGRSTADALHQVMKAWDLRQQDCAYGGDKDRAGSTTQFFTVKGGHEQCLELKDVLVEFLGYSDRQMGLDAIEGNFFKIVVRDLPEHMALQAVKDLKVIDTDGFVNYFDDQRFVNYDPRQGFLGERLLKGHLNVALKLYLTASDPLDKKADQERKAFIDQHWKDWQACLSVAKTSFEKRVFARLVNDPKAIQPLAEDIPEDHLRMAVVSYQAFLWNELIRRLLSSRGWSDRFAPGVVGDYLFFSKLNGRDYDHLKSMVVSFPSANAEMPDKMLGRIYEKLLAEREVHPDLFNKIKMRKVSFKPGSRKVMVKVKDVAAAIQDDDLYPGRVKLLLEVFLPRDSYATMFLKRLFAEAF